LRIENFLEQPRRGKILVTPHKAKPQCGAVRRSIFLEQPRRGKIPVTPHKAKPQCGAVRRSIFLEQPRRGKILVTPHKAKPQCGVAQATKERSVGYNAQGEAAVWCREEEPRKS
jgi:hypothetical protein